MADKLADQVSYMIAGANWRLEQQIRVGAEASHLPFEQWRVLALLVEQEGRTMSDLAQHAFIEPPTLTKMIDRMVADNLVYRVPDSHDRRRILIFVSERGWERCAQTQSVFKATEERVTRHLGRRKVAALKRLVRDLASAGLDMPDPGASRSPDRPQSMEGGNIVDRESTDRH